MCCFEEPIAHNGGVKKGKIWNCALARKYFLWRPEKTTHKQFWRFSTTGTYAFFDFKFQNFLKIAKFLQFSNIIKSYNKTYYASAAMC